MQSLQTDQNVAPVLNDSPPAIVHQISVAELERQSVFSPAPETCALPPLHQPVTSESKASIHQELLFPQTPRSICEELGLDFWEALKLYHEDWLSFSPETATR